MSEKTKAKPKDKVEFILRQRGVTETEGARLTELDDDGTYRVETRRQNPRTKYPQDIVGNYWFRPTAKNRAEFMALPDGPQLVF